MCEYRRKGRPPRALVCLPKHPAILRPARQGHVRTGGEADISGPQGKSEDQPHAKQIAPAEGVTPPAEVHACPTVHSAPCTIRYRCLPTGVTGSRSRPTPPGFHPTASLIDISAFLAAVAIECIE